jgi:hypothetical protein
VSLTKLQLIWEFLVNQRNVVQVGLNRVGG